jgi:hypothetical protein
MFNDFLYFSVIATALLLINIIDEYLVTLYSTLPSLFNTRKIMLAKKLKMHHYKYFHTSS